MHDGANPPLHARSNRATAFLPSAGIPVPRFVAIASALHATITFASQLFCIRLAPRAGSFASPPLPNRRYSPSNPHPSSEPLSHAPWKRFAASARSCGAPCPVDDASPTPAQLSANPPSQPCLKSSSAFAAFSGTLRS